MTQGKYPGYWLDDRGSLPGRGRDFSPCHRVQTDSGAHPASCPMGTGAVTMGVKRPGRKAKQSRPCQG